MYIYTFLSTRSLCTRACAGKKCREGQEGWFYYADTPELGLENPSCPICHDLAHRPTIFMT